ncbi:PREDICTED: uncharacterized protein LOC108567039 [Nicrophorus vespilloides]|uniref:Uncharacterized protein LOC108567039 n=1 Tax=Nicrophorus vespilloides TaxID=110193 RepID=A0ABM1N7B8_NICVS|nr:PREDICTED: uncharacterized protein LOC108567039 [Nicrophorus vespilloides]XP_017782718.1 PREDICTED: uncharacterized protein LOC108567039 [Nicrophorus vespilloides]
MYQPEQNRNDTSQGMHFHVHQCICTSPLYNPYRQPLLAQYVPPPVPRPYNLAHYQYTTYNMPYNIPVFNANAIAHQIPSTTPSGIPIPDPVGSERREAREVGESLRTAEDVEDFGTMPNDANTEDFTKFLEQGCIIAEKIAIRNQHRPCFKNIQNLCNRTKNEILKPSHTVSNIHSQGIPWATKDFIYAYVRLINCWHMLKGYLQAKDGTLGNIDCELTAEFKSCYAVWESHTKDLAEHMIRIFSNLDNNVSNPIPNQTFVNRTRVVRPVPLEPIEVPLPTATQPLATEETNQFSETTTEPSPREEESDGESRVYMKPGSYSVPKKPNSDNSSPSIEFFETAKNISCHYKKLEAKKQNEANDSDWKNAITATSNLIKKNSSYSGDAVEDIVSVDNVRKWLYSDHFDQQNLVYSLSDLRSILPDRPVTVLQRNETKNKEELRSFGFDEVAITGLLEDLEKTDLNQTLLNKMSIHKDSPDNLQSIIHKHNCKMYKTQSAIIQDLRRLVHHAQMMFNGDMDVLKQIKVFTGVLDDALQRFHPEGTMEEILGLDLNDVDISINKG